MCPIYPYISSWFFLGWNVRNDKCLLSKFHIVVTELNKDIYWTFNHALGSSGGIASDDRMINEQEMTLKEQFAA
jgi:hypothetical protein